MYGLAVVSGSRYGVEAGIPLSLMKDEDFLAPFRTKDDRITSILIADSC